MTDTQSINKPITVAQTELANKLINDINDSHLHVAIIFPVVSELFTIVQDNLNAVREKEKNEYETALSESLKMDKQ